MSVLKMSKSYYVQGKFGVNCKWVVNNKTYARYEDAIEYCNLLYSQKDSGNIDRLDPLYKRGPIETTEYSVQSYTHIG